MITFSEYFAKPGFAGKAAAFVNIKIMDDAEKELIKSGGENVFPAEVETIIMEHEAVKEVCVFGVPDPKFGEGIKAVCVLHENQTLTKQELIEFVGTKIAGYKKPRLCRVYRRTAQKKTVQ